MLPLQKELQAEDWVCTAIFSHGDTSLYSVKYNLLFPLNRRVLEVLNTLVITEPPIWTLVIETCFTVSVLGFSAADSVRDQEVR